ncbi:MAG: ATP-dependent DNA helicase RecG [Parcubacteria group bacterium Gr01-1014_2]|nr:MAG: ATP-dependent DNA helicase RecG [Parcubacteria group bacterium Gr01-1014_2]
MNLETPIENLRYVGKIYQPRLKKLGIKTIRDLLWHFPMRYDDWTERGKVEDIKPNQKISLIGKVASIENKRIFPRRMILTTASIEDETGKVKAVWYNQPFLVNTIKPEKFISLSGKVKLDKYGVYLQNPAYEVLKNDQFSIFNFQSNSKSQIPNLKHTAGLIPVYPETEGLTSRYLRFLIKPLLKFSSKVQDFLPKEILERQRLDDVRTGLNEIHFPSSLEKADQARKRFAFDELFLLQLKALSERRKIQQQKAVSIKFNQEIIKNFVSSLAFELTGAQKIALWEILKDLEKPYPMNRLLNGDVGSGKTIVAAAAALETALAGYQAAIMAPTEVLANQHFQTFSKVLKNFDVKLGLITSSGIKGHGLSSDIVIGTHSLISAKGGPASGGQKNVSFKNLALAVIDEQHRFGVDQRAALLRSESGNNSKFIIPHLLSMTATPIPRTLALTVYGDLDISILDEMPKGRTLIETKLIPPEKRDEAYNFIRAEVKEGRQVFVICPRIEDPNGKIQNSNVKKKERQLSFKDYLNYEVKAVKVEYEKLSKEIFKDLRVAMLHGKMKSKEKENIMAKFSAKGGSASGGKNNIDILVSTSVIEVGVDVPNATIMMIEGAEKFGLAQLHQFRGRVGRGKHKSYCLLFTESPLVGTTRRLEALLKTNNGFKLAEMDLKIRGPGEFTGTKQSGIPDLAMAFLADMNLIKQARAEAKLILKNLNRYPLVSKKLSEFNKNVHLE